MSHNLRTPLTAITGWVDLLEQGVAADPPLVLRRIQREVGHVSSLIGRLLELARWDLGAPRLHLENVPLLEPVMEVAESLEEAAQQNEVALVFESVLPDVRVLADRVRVRELFQVILENAVHHAGPGVTVHLSMRVDGQRVEVEIRDDGCGLEAAALALANQRQSRPQGGGLGLAIAHKLVEAHGGDLAIASLSGRGVTVRFSLPKSRT